MLFLVSIIKYPFSSSLILLDCILSYVLDICSYVFCFNHSLSSSVGLCSIDEGGKGFASLGFIFFISRFSETLRNRISSFRGSDKVILLKKKLQLYIN